MVKIKSANHLKEGDAVDVYVISFDERLKPLEEDLKARFKGLDCNKLEFCHFNELKRKINDQGNSDENLSTDNLFQDRQSYISIDIHQENDHQVIENSQSKIRDEIEELKLSQAEYLQLLKEQFKSKLESIANTLNNSGNKSIIMIDELPLHLVASGVLEDAGERKIFNNFLRFCKNRKTEYAQYHVDLSYLKKYENIEFVLSIKPWGFSENCKEYEIRFPLEAWDNQHYHILKNAYRNNQAIFNFKRFYQANDPCQTRRGYPAIETNQEVLPSLLDPPNDVGVIWAHLWVESIYSKKVYFDKISSHLKKIDGTIAILYGGLTREKINQTAEKFYMDYSKDGLQLQKPCEEFDFNGKEADVIVYFTDGILNLQTISRARQLLIIVSEDTTSIKYRDEILGGIWDNKKTWIIDALYNEFYLCTKIMNEAAKKNLLKKLIHVSKLKIIMLIILSLLRFLLVPFVMYYNCIQFIFCRIQPFVEEVERQERYELICPKVRKKQKKKEMSFWWSRFSLFSLIGILIGTVGTAMLLGMIFGVGTYLICLPDSYYLAGNVIFSFGAVYGYYWYFVFIFPKHYNLWGTCI